MKTFACSLPQNPHGPSIEPPIFLVDDAWVR